jgi:hypothetical protein
MDLTNTKTVFEILQIAFTCFALAAGGGFFLYRIVTGWLIINLGLSLRLERQPLKDGLDEIAVVIVLAKGSIDSVWVSDLQLRLTPLSNGQPIGEPTIRKVENFLPVYDDRGLVEWDRKAERGVIVISPGETIECASHFHVTTGTTYFVEVVVIGHNQMTKFSLLRLFNREFIQWRASNIALPYFADPPVAGH